MTDKLRCWWFGCERHPEDYAPPDELTCMHCGRCIEYSDLVGYTRHYRFCEFWRSLFRKVWPKRCADCGHKWRKCDDTIDHIPF